jgi:predicted membrane protein
MFPPFLVGPFFLAAWILMIFWGIVAQRVGVATLGYPNAMLVTLGLWLVIFPVTLRPVGGRRWKRSANRKGSSQETVGSDATASVTFGEIKRRVVTHDLKGGKADVRFGAVRYDFYDSAIPNPPATLDVDAVFGEVEVNVPSAWKVHVELDTRFGEVKDERRRVTPLDGKPDLIIRGRILFAGVKLRD